MLFYSHRPRYYLLIAFLIALFPLNAPASNNRNTDAEKHLNKHSEKRFWNSLSRSWLTGEQIRLLNMAHEIGMLDRGKAHASILQAILMQESHAGDIGRIGDTNAPMGKRSYGVMQIKLSTAWDVLRKYRDLGQFDTEEALLIKLVTDDYFNIQIASKHLLGLRKATHRDAQAIMAYNTGLSRAKKHWYPEKYRYVKKISRYIRKVVTPFNKRFGNEAYQLAFNN